jgi:hypothetical protein
LDTFTGSLTDSKTGKVWEGLQEESEEEDDEEETDPITAAAVAEDVATALD